ncbi:MAG: hypothetical protein P4L33_17690 [Capsulimonadaceae bacterium]|nr:hypothetical protein [Capsulimonadaceae bacterium]
MHFPYVDPIPVPAPILLMKALGILTLAMHFVAVQLLVGSLVAVCWFSLRGKQLGTSQHKTAAHVLARRVPIIMTYVINLGIPPLLFAQVIYGRALYTSSVLIGALWISVIPLLMLCYWLLYRMADKTAAGKPAAHVAFIALIIAGCVGRILSYNMTLMLRPEVWQKMYAGTATGLHLPPSEPTSIYRWAFIVIGSLLLTGLWTVLNSGLPTIDGETKALMRKTGGVLALLGGIIQIAIGYLVFVHQPVSVQDGLQQLAFYKISGIVWFVAAALATLLGATQIIAKSTSLPLNIAACTSGFVGLVGAVCVRDGIRDVTLNGKGFDVFHRLVYSNWWVLGLFFALFAISLVAMGWLLWVMKQAKPVSEQVAS